MAKPHATKNHCIDPCFETHDRDHCSISIYAVSVYSVRQDTRTTKGMVEIIPMILMDVEGSFNHSDEEETVGISSQKQSTQDAILPDSILGFPTCLCVRHDAMGPILTHAIEQIYD